MRIAVASGKGGTGKTTVAVNLSMALAETSDTVLVDCDVEAPNAALFFHREYEFVDMATVTSFSVDAERCVGCGRCAGVCRFNAVAMGGKLPIFFSDMCHACGGCMLACEHDAIRPRQRENGCIGSWRSENLSLIEGRLHVGEAMAVSLIDEVKRRASELGAMIEVLDCPPGTSCPMLAAVRGTDFVILVTEPTPFGLNDLRLAVGAVRLLGIPFGVVINRDGCGDDRVKEYCYTEGIVLLRSIPDDYRVAQLYSQGKIAMQELPEYKRYLKQLAEEVTRRCLG